jgi:hypothetical protein
LKAENKLRTFENRVLRRIFGPESRSYSVSTNRRAVVARNVQQKIKGTVLMLITGTGQEVNL